MFDIGVLNAKVVSFADDTRLYSKIVSITSTTSDYVSPNFYVIDNVNNLKDLGHLVFKLFL